MLSSRLERSPVADMAAPTHDLALQTYLIELTRARTLTPDQIVEELGATTAVWAPVVVCSTTT
ncbi:hypothetical protein GCM10023339_27790 [Alloalcanivorax gelatiniphagus]